MVTHTSVSTQQSVTSLSTRQHLWPSGRWASGMPLGDGWVDMGTAIVTVGGTVPCLGSRTVHTEKVNWSTSCVHPALPPDCGYRVTSCFELRPPLPFQPRWARYLELWAKMTPFSPNKWPLSHLTATVRRYHSNSKRNKDHRQDQQFYGCKVDADHLKKNKGRQTKSPPPISCKPILQADINERSPFFFCPHWMQWDQSLGVCL